MPARIERLAVTPVKGTRMSLRQAVTLEAGGVREDRLFHLIDERNRMVNGKQLGELSAIVADYDEQLRRLRISFPDGSELSAEVRLGEPLGTRFYSRPAPVRRCWGPSRRRSRSIWGARCASSRPSARAALSTVAKPVA